MTKLEGRTLMAMPVSQMKRLAAATLIGSVKNAGRKCLIGSLSRSNFPPDCTHAIEHSDCRASAQPMSQSTNPLCCSPVLDYREAKQKVRKHIPFGAEKQELRPLSAPFPHGKIHWLAAAKKQKSPAGR